MKFTAQTRDLVLAHTLGYHCGLGDKPEFEFPNVEKAWNEYKTYIKDEVRFRHWPSSSQDSQEREFRQGYTEACLKKLKDELQRS